MAFSREIVENLLVAARRCCCVCRRFCGTNIEIHHIQPVAEGGSDEEDNGIPLCFDCHASVHMTGSPRGRKFTPNELRRLRNEWFVDSKPLVVGELQKIKAEILEHLASLRIPSIYDTVLNITETLEMLLKAKKNEDHRKAYETRYRIGLISDPAYYARLGTLELEYKNYSDAVQLLSQSLKLDNSQAPVHFNVFNAFLALGEFDEAISAYQQAIDLDDTLCILPKEYQPLKILGRGSSATVYKAKVVASGKMVAVKVLRGEHMRNYAVATAFLNETQLLQALEHDALLPIYDHGLFGERYYVAWEYVEALSLKQLIESRTLLPRDVLVIAENLVSVLDYLHRKGIVHRDIKPHNIMVVGTEFDVKLVDFGVAMTVENATVTRMFGVGTVAYAAPEIIAGPVSDLPAADIYALGMTLFEVMTGGLPKTNVRISPPVTYPAVVWATVERMLRSDPTQRPSAAEVRTVLERQRVESKK